jgi:polysaccharide pyruvyl transferase CsaB
MASRLLLAGYFGCGNYGDDAILLGFIEGVQGMDCRFSVLAKEPEKMIKTYGLTAVARMDPGSVREAIEECDALVFPGGSIFQDVTSVRSVFYYSRLVKLAKKSRKKVFLLSQGVGPLNTWLGRRLAAGAFRSADVITVRDPQSSQTLKSIGVPAVPRVAADMAFLMPPSASQDGPSFEAGGMKTVGISARAHGKDKGKKVVEIFAELARLLFQGGYLPVMFAMDDEDAALIEQVSKLNGGKVPDLKGITGPGPLQDRIARMEAVIAMRLHAAILATSVGVPPYMISYDPKVTAFANALGFSNPPNIEGLTAQKAFEGFQAFIKNRELHSEALLRRREDFKRQARISIDLVKDALG